MTTTIDTHERTDPALFLLVAPLETMPGGASVRPPCQGVDPDWFFADVPEVIEDAKRVCRPCAVRLACLSGALRRREPHGVWGGELFQDGVVIARKRPRGRPRKTGVLVNEPVELGQHSDASGRLLGQGVTERPGAGAVRMNGPVPPAESGLRRCGLHSQAV
jgi:WhiB family redox-sensing transcriptional regulator